MLIFLRIIRRRRTRLNFILALALASLAFLLLSESFVEATQTQPAPSAPTVSSEQTIKALGILFQVVRNVEAYVDAKELSSIHNEDMMLYGALTILIGNSKQTSNGQKELLAMALLALGRQVADLHEAADADNQMEAESRLKIVSNSFSDLKKFYNQDLLSRAEAAGSKYMCPMHPDIIGNSADLCAKCGMVLDQNIRINLFSSGQTIVSPTTMKGSIQTLGPLTSGVPGTFNLRLRKIIDGSPILSTDLRVVHTEKIHLFLIDPSLKDYHHLHPEPTAIPGTYSFFFTPRKPGSYRAWADVRSTLTGFQEYVMTDIASSTEGEPLSDRARSLDAKVEHLKFHLSFNSKEIQVGQPVLAKLRITKAGGTPFNQLEPVMGMFAHIAGFNEDYNTVLHLHPKGPKG